MHLRHLETVKNYSSKLPIADTVREQREHSVTDAKDWNHAQRYDPITELQRFQTCSAFSTSTHLLSKEVTAVV